MENEERRGTTHGAQKKTETTTGNVKISQPDVSVNGDGARSANDRHEYAFANLPEELRALPQWGVWLREYQRGEPKNVPYNANTGTHLSVTDSSTWCDHATALAAYRQGTRGQWDGINFVVTTENHIVGLDLDDCIDEHGDLTPDAQTIVDLWQSYVEYSPSRRGIRGFAYGTLPAGKRHTGKFEMYSTGKAFTVTGWHLAGTPTTIEQRTEAIADIHARFIQAKKKPQPTKSTSTFPDEDSEPLEDEEVIALALRAKNGDRIQALIDGDLAGYASTSEADLAVCNYLAFYCGRNSHEQIDRIFREHFPFFRPEKWDARHYGDGTTYGQHTIKVALEGRTEFYTRPLQWKPSQHEPLTDEEQSAVDMAQEREPDTAEDLSDGFTEAEEPDTTTEPDAAEPRPNDTPPMEEASVVRYPCPPIIWQGMFKTVADLLGLYTWEVWFGVYGALSARAQRNVHCYYFSDHLYGNTYALLIGRTAAGKNLVVNIARALLGDDYKIRSGLNSGQALVPLLTDDPLHAKGGHLKVRGVPVLLLCSEWSRIAQMAGIEHATLIEDVNDLHMRHYSWSQARSHKNPSGGDLEITEPKLTIVGTTTRKLFHAALTDRMIGSGGINRHLIVPGNATFQPYRGKSYHAGRDLAGLIDHLKNHTFGLGNEIKDMYEPDAWDAFLAFQETFILPLQNNPETSEALSRLHLHLQQLGAMYAWQMQAPQITLDHFNAAKAITEASHRFVVDLLAERGKSFEPTKVQEVETAMEARAIAQLKKKPGLTRREFSRQMSTKKVGYAAWMKTVDGLLRAGVLETKTKGQREELYVLLGF